MRKILIVLVLLVAVAAVVTLKSRPKPMSPSTVATAPMATVSDAKPRGVPRMLELGAAKCTPCKMMQGVMTELEQEYGDRLQIDFIDVWEDSEAGARYGVQTIPTQILYDAKGKEIFRHVGFYPKKEIVAKFKELGVKL